MLLPWNGGVSSLRRRQWGGALQSEHRAGAEQPAQVRLDVVQHVGTGGEHLLANTGSETMTVSPKSGIRRVTAGP